MEFVVAGGLAYNSPSQAASDREPDWQFWEFFGGAGHAEIKGGAALLQFHEPPLEKKNPTGVRAFT